jgi:recombination protein RecR
VISPLDGINAQDLKIKELIARIDAGLRSEGPKIKEVILALDADLEGDTTILYLAKLLQGKEVRLSRLAHGVPIGSDIEFIDDRTLGQALENRVEL